LKHGNPFFNCAQAMAAIGSVIRKVATDDAGLSPVVNGFFQTPGHILAVSDQPTFATLDMLVDIEAEHPIWPMVPGIRSIQGRMRGLGVVLDQDDAILVAEARISK